MIYILTFLTIFTATNSPFTDMNPEMELLKAANSISKSNIKEVHKHLSNAVLYQPKNEKNKVILAILYSSLKQYNSSLKLLRGIKNNDFASFYRYYNLYMGSTPSNFKQHYKNVTKYLVDAKLSKDKLMFIAVTLNSVDKALSLSFIKKAIKIDENILDLQYVVSPYKDIVYLIYKNLSPPYDYNYYNSLAKLYLSFGDYKKAIEELNKSVKLGKKTELAYLLLSDAYILAEDYETALKFLKKAEGNLAIKEEIYLNYITIYNNTNRPKKELLAICKKGLFLSRNSLKIKYCVAKNYYELKKYDKAYLELQYILRKKLNDPDSNVLMARTVKKILEEIDQKVIDGKISAKYAKRLRTEYESKQEIDFVYRAFKARPYDFEILKLLYGLLGIYIDDMTGVVSSSGKYSKNLFTEVQKEYEKNLLEKTRENEFISFYKNFKEFTKTKKDEYFKKMTSLNIAPIIMIYANYLKSKNSNDLTLFLKQFSKNYLDVLHKPYNFNQRIYEFTLNKGVLEYTRLFYFIIPEYF